MSRGVVRVLPRALGLALACTLAAAAGARAQVPGGDPSCTAGTAAERCYREGLRQAQAAFAARDTTPARRRGAARLLLGACGGGVGDGCYIAARLTEADAEMAADDTLQQAAAARAVLLFSLGCRAAAPSGAACTTAGFHYADRPRHTYLDSALFFLRRGCEEGEPSACYRAAELLDDWMTPGAPRSRLATARIQAACEAGSPGACLAAARRAEERLAGESAARRATPTSRRERDGIRRAYGRACGDSLPAGCTALGVLHATGSLGFPVAPDSALHYLVPTCDGDPARGVVGHGPACRALGRMAAGLGPGSGEAEPHDSVQVDTALALERLEQACVLLDADACGDLAYHGHQMLRLDGVEAFFRAANACREGSGHACRVAGRLAAEGHADDQADAERYLRQACALGDAEGCGARAGIGMEPGVEFKYLRRACTLGDAGGCQLLAMWVPAAAQSAQPYGGLLARACALGSAAGCWDMMLLARGAGREREEGEYHARACRLEPESYCKRKV